jgi:energy-converting hydrogenase A subunit M
MPTKKNRLNITLTKEVEITLNKLARRDNVPTATKAFDLLMKALEIEEDEIWDAVAKKRDTSKAKYVTHKNAWL